MVRGETKQKKANPHDTLRSKLNITKKIHKKRKVNKKQVEDENESVSSESQDEMEQWLQTIDYSKITHEEFKEMIKQKYAEQSKKNKNSSTYFFQNYILEKSCEVCHKFNDDQHLLLCDYCDDAYHTYCLTPVLVEVPSEDQEWCCPLCLKQKTNSKAENDKQKKRQSMLEEHFHPQKQIDNKICNKCQKEIKQPNQGQMNSNGKKSILEIDKFDVCIKCNNFYHQTCFNNKKNAILCRTCETLIKKQIPKNQTQITQYFDTSAKIEIKQTDEIEALQKGAQKLHLESPSKKVDESLITKIKCKKSQVFKLPVPHSDPSKIIQQQQNMIYAFKAKSIIFDDDLRFSNQNCSPSCNDSNLEPNLQKISKANYLIFQRFKEMTRQGQYAPLLIEEDKLQGFIVRATEDIPCNTLICEYVGDVDFARNRIFDKNDSIMDLLRTARSSTSLVICPEKFGNIARFLSGVNNSDKKSCQKQNVQSIRFSVDGHARVVLYAKKNIKAQEILYYDYNAGGFGEYPTDNFV